MKRRKSDQFQKERTVATEDASPRQSPRTAATSRWWAAPFFYSLAGGLLMWASFPPMGQAWLIWFAPLPWLFLVQATRQVGPRTYLAIWFGATIPWLGMLEGVSRAHPANKVGCLFLCLYVAAYVPAFVFATRMAVHRCGIRLMLAAPVVWTAAELARGYVLTGFSMALLGHALAEWTLLIQIADLFGAYGVSSLIVLIAACLAEIPQRTGGRRKYRPLAVVGAALGATLLYGAVRMRDVPPTGERGLRIALLQGTNDKLFEINPERERQTFAQYWRLMEQARKEHEHLDLIVWPEGAFSAAMNTDVIPDNVIAAPPESGLSETEFRKRVEQSQRSFAETVKRASETAARVWRDGDFHHAETHLIVGAETVRVGNQSVRLYNSAIHIGPGGIALDRYYKMHPVMFGEYIPLGDLFPWLYRLTPMRQGLSRGEAPGMFDVHGWQLSPSICFESTVPHLVRRQCRTLARNIGKVPDVLVNVTDDGWFWGTSVLDYQLQCAVFRTIEMRIPMVVAANTGISAWIDGSGRIVARAPKRQEAVIVAEVHQDGRSTIYRIWGDFPAILCLLWTLSWIRRGQIVGTEVAPRQATQGSAKKRNATAGTADRAEG